VSILPEPIAHVPLYFIVSRQHKLGQETVERFNQALAAIEQSGEKQQIDQDFEKFLEATVP
jgi:ABC-type amino acid transport substrate-binding protein